MSHQKSSIGTGNEEMGMILCPTAVIAWARFSYFAIRIAITQICLDLINPLDNRPVTTEIEDHCVVIKVLSALDLPSGPNFSNLLVNELNRARFIFFPNQMLLNEKPRCTWS